MKNKFFQESFSLRSSCNRITKQEASGIGEWLDGDVATPFGIVSVMAEPSQGNGREFTRLDFVHNGRLHIRTYSKFFTKRGISRLARKFAKEITQ